MNPIRIFSFVRMLHVRTLRFLSATFFFSNIILTTGTGPDHYVISTSPRYEDVSSILAVLDSNFSAEKIQQRKKVLVKATMQVWKRDDKITFTAPPSQLAVSGPLNTTTTTSSSKSLTTRVFRVDNVRSVRARRARISSPSLMNSSVKYGRIIDSYCKKMTDILEHTNNTLKCYENLTRASRSNTGTRHDTSFHLCTLSFCNET